MSIFDDRERSQEKKFVMDAEKEFKAEARRNKLLGHWVGKLLDMDDDEAEKYALSVIISDMEESGDDDVFRKLRKDLTEANIDISDEAIRAKMAECLNEARSEVYDS